MFTGLIETTSVVQSITGSSERTLSIHNPWNSGVVVGDSIAVDGVCLTATTVTTETLSFFVSAVTGARTAAKFYRTGAVVNLERALKVGDRLHGHFVQGHVDTLARVSSVQTLSQGREVTIEIPTEFSSHLIPRASVTVQGISLTMAAADSHSFSVTLIPETLKQTTLGTILRSGALLNIEFDILGKYILSTPSDRKMMSLMEKL
ncbi:riboflavin synthase [bacterium]|nr:riboflavin synthase [bacterium]